jgi:hypothetical protein
MELSQEELRSLVMLVLTVSGYIFQRWLRMQLRTRAWIRAARNGVDQTRKDLNLEPLDWAQMVEVEQDKLIIEEGL